MKKIWLVIIIVISLSSLEGLLTYAVYNSKHPASPKPLDSTTKETVEKKPQPPVVQKTEPNNVRVIPKEPPIKTTPIVPKKEEKSSLLKDNFSSLKGGTYTPTSNCDLLRYFSDAVEITEGKSYASVIKELDNQISMTSSDLTQFDLEIKRAAVFTLLHKEVKANFDIIIAALKEIEEDTSSTIDVIIEARSQINKFERASVALDAEIILLLNDGGKKLIIMQKKYPNIDFDKRYDK